MYEPKKFDFKDSISISEEQLLEHYAIYEESVKCLNETENKLEKDKEIIKDINLSLKLGQSYERNAVVLHELYFSSLLTTGHRQEPSGKIVDYIERDFGSFDNFSEAFKNIGQNMCGWVLLILGRYNKKLCLIGQNDHNKGLIYHDSPIIVMDVHEHAYAKDFGTNKLDYIEMFLQYMNWEEVNKRLEIATGN
jgi:Fe-Mn family superoxide dismutase